MQGTSNDSAAPSGAARLLVVDDNADAADTLADLLRVLGYEVRCAGDGASAMAALDGYRPQLALLDIGLPGEDGYAVARRMRDDPRRAQAKLVALSGYSADAKRSESLGAHFDAHLVKPVSVDELIGLLEKMLG
jgi:CheY-like chemotaxis protein